MDQKLLVYIQNVSVKALHTLNVGTEIIARILYLDVGHPLHISALL